MSAILNHPLIAELRARRKQLSERLLWLVEEAQRIKESVNPPIVAEYDRLFRELEIVLQRKALEAAEIGRREELLRLKLERGEKLSPKMIALVHGMVDREFARVRRRIDEAFNMDKQGRERAARKRARQAESDSEVARMYRSIVKKLHPDVQYPNTLLPDNASQHSSAPQDKRTDFEKHWQAAQEAYHHRNTQKLRSIYELVCLTEEQQDFTDVPSAEEYLRAEIARLTRRVHSEETKLKNLTNAEPYTLRDCIGDAAWQDQERVRLEQEIAVKERDIERSKAFLASIHAEDWQAIRASDVHQHSEIFNDDFMENTYFGHR
jgi:hypothetical protein